MTILRMAPNAHHVMEFYGKPGKSVYHGTCTQTSGAMVLASALGTPVDHDGVVNLMLDMTQSMQDRGTAAANGAATVAGMAEELRRRGATILVEWDYQEPLGADWHSLLIAHAGIHPILLQVANAQGLYNAGGQAEDQGVHYHAVAILGIADTGYVVGDPNNPSVEATFDIYPYAALLNARPCGLIMLDVPHTAPMPTPPVKEVPLMSLPAGYQDHGSAVTAPNGCVIAEPILTLWRTNSAFAGDPLENAVDFPGGNTEQIFYGTLLGVVGGHAVVGGAGQRMIDQAKQLGVLQDHLAALQAQLATAQTATPAAEPSDPHTAKALAVVAALKDALAN